MYYIHGHNADVEIITSNIDNAISNACQIHGFGIDVEGNLVPLVCVDGVCAPKDINNLTENMVKSLNSSWIQCECDKLYAFQFEMYFAGAIATRFEDENIEDFLNTEDSLILWIGSSFAKQEMREMLKSLHSTNRIVFINPDPVEKAFKNLLSVKSKANQSPKMIHSLLNASLGEVVDMWSLIIPSYKLIGCSLSLSVGTIRGNIYYINIVRMQEAYYTKKEKGKCLISIFTNNIEHEIQNYLENLASRQGEFSILYLVAKRVYYVEAAFKLERQSENELWEGKRYFWTTVSFSDDCPADFLGALIEIFSANNIYINEDSTIGPLGFPYSEESEEIKYMIYICYLIHAEIPTVADLFDKSSKFFVCS